MGAEAREEIQQKRQYITEDALDDAGYVLTFKDALVAGNVSKTDADGEPPVGINLMSTDNPITKVAAADVRVTILDSGDAWVKLEPNATRAIAILVGDWVQGSSNGMVEGLESTISGFANIDKALGIALQEVAAGVDLPTAGEEPYRTGYILVKLRPRCA